MQELPTNKRKKTRSHSLFSTYFSSFLTLIPSRLPIPNQCICHKKERRQSTHVFLYTWNVKRGKPYLYDNFNDDYDVDDDSKKIKIKMKIKCLPVSYIMLLNEKKIKETCLTPCYKKCIPLLKKLWFSFSIYLFCV